MLSAAASLGLIHLWDVDGGLTPIDKYLYTSEDNIKVLDNTWCLCWNVATTTSVCVHEGAQTGTELTNYNLSRVVIYLAY